MHACSLSSLVSNTCSKSSIAPGYCADFCAFRWMITRSTQRIATARLHHFQCHVIALLCLPCDTVYQNQTGVGKDHVGGCKHICIQSTKKDYTFVVADMDC